MAEISYLLNKLSLSYVQVLFSGINNLCGLFVCLEIKCHRTEQENILWPKYN